MPLPPITVLLTASGSPGTAALARALRENGERDIRLVGTDMSDRSIGRHVCDAFHLVPAGTEPGFAEAIREVVGREGVDAVLPQSSYDLDGLAAEREGFSETRVLVSGPRTIRACNDKAECYDELHRIGVPAPEFRRARGGRAVEAAARELGYPERAVCFKPAVSSGSWTGTSRIACVAAVPSSEDAASTRR